MYNIELDLFPKSLEGYGNSNINEVYCGKKGNVFGLQYCYSAIFSGKYGMPLLDAYTGEIPDEYITYSEHRRIKDYSCGVTFFDEDNVLESVWRSPSRYISTLSRFKCVTEPDLSMKIGEPLAVQIANAYRNHAIAYYMQQHGLKVIPSVSWSSEESFEFCFDGYSKHGAVIVSTIGTMKDERSRVYFRNGFLEMLRRIDPDSVIIYGDTNDELKAWLRALLEQNSCWEEET